MTGVSALCDEHSFLIAYQVQGRANGTYPIKGAGALSLNYGLEGTQHVAVLLRVHGQARAYRLQRKHCQCGGEPYRAMTLSFCTP